MRKSLVPSAQPDKTIMSVSSTTVLWKPNKRQKIATSAPSTANTPQIEVANLRELDREDALLFDPATVEGPATSDSEDQESPVVARHRRGGGIVEFVETPTQVDGELTADASFVEEQDDGEEVNAGEDGVGEEEDVNRVVPEVWDHPQELEMDREEDSFVNDVDRMIQCIGDAKLVTALFDMSCTMVFDSVTTTMGVMSANDCYVAAAATFDDHMTSFLQKTYSRDDLLEYLPGKTWPASYVTYVNKAKSRLPSATALKNATWNGIPVNQRKQIYFGMLIKKKNRDTKAYVNMHLVPHYMHEEELPSGHTREQLLRAIRRTLWPLEAAIRGMAAQRKAVSRCKEKGETLAAEDVKTIYEKARDSAFRKLSDTYYPPEFLVFLLFSKPARDPSQILASINGGNPALPAVDPTFTAPVVALTGDAAQNALHSPTVAIRQMRAAGGREARRVTERLSAGGAQGRVGRGGAEGAEHGAAHPPAPITVIHTHVVEPPVLEKRIAALEKLIALTEKRAMDATQKQERIANYEDELVNLLEEQRRA